MTFQPLRTLDTGPVTPIPAHEEDESETKKQSKPRSARRATGELAEERLAWCGKAWIVSRDPHTGLDYEHTRYCERRDCPICAQRRGYELQQRVALLLNPKHNLIFDHTLPVSYVYLERAVAQMYRRQWHNKNCYLNIPQQDGRDLLIFQHTDLVPDAQLLDKDFVNNSDWTQIQFTPDNANTSGGLGRLAKSPQLTKETSDGTVYVPEIFIAPQEQGPRAHEIRACKQYAKICTVDDMPKTIKEVQAALDRWSGILATELTKRGIAYEVKQIRSFVSVTRINWSQSVLSNATELLQQNIAPEAGYNALAHRLDELQHPLISIGQTTIDKYDT